VVTETTACWVRTRRYITRWVMLLNQSICLIWGAWLTRPTFAQSTQIAQSPSRMALRLACWTYINEASPYSADIRWNCWNLSEQRLTVCLMFKTNLDAPVVAFWQGAPGGGSGAPLGVSKVKWAKPSCSLESFTSRSPKVSTCTPVRAPRHRSEIASSKHLASTLLLLSLVMIISLP